MSGTSLNSFLKTLKRSDLIITPRYDAWLIAHPEFPELTDDDRALIEQSLSPRGSRKGVFTGSQALKCPRFQMFQFIGIDPLRKVDPVLQLRFFDGTWRHLRWQITLMHAIPGFVAEARVDSPLFRGALDGVHHLERWGFELKGTAFMGKVITEGVIENHLHQATRYWLATDQDPAFPRELRSWVFIYENKQTQEHREIVVQRSAKVEYQVQKELDYLTKCVRDHDLPPVLQECSRGRGPTFNSCAYAHMCLTTQTWDEAVRLTPTRNRNAKKAASTTNGQSPNGRAGKREVSRRLKPPGY